MAWWQPGGPLPPRVLVVGVPVGDEAPEGAHGYPGAGATELRGQGRSQIEFGNEGKERIASRRDANRRAPAPRFPSLGGCGRDEITEGRNFLGGDGAAVSLRGTIGSIRRDRPGVFGTASLRCFAPTILYVFTSSASSRAGCAGRRCHCCADRAASRADGENPIGGGPGRGGAIGHGGGRSSSRSSRVGIACSPACRAWPRRCSSRSSRICSACTFRACSSRPDLMPSDITGTDILEEDPATGHRRFVFVPGPIFTQVLLADEIKPHAAEDAGRAAGGDAGKDGHAGGQGLRNARAVPGPGHAKSDRAGGDLSAARGAARPFPLRAADQLSLVRGRSAAGRAPFVFADGQHYRADFAGNRFSPCARR